MSFFVTSQVEQGNLKHLLSGLRDNVPQMIANRVEDRMKVVVDDVLPRLAAMDLAQTGLKEQLNVHSQVG